MVRKLVAKNNQPAAEVPVVISPAFRIGGAMITVALVFFIYTAIEIFRSGWMTPFPVTPRFVMILVAAAVLGAFATVNKNQQGSMLQVSALSIALFLVVAGRFVPNEVLVVWAQYWLPAYGVLSLLCGLAIRRAAT